MKEGANGRGFGSGVISGEHSFDPDGAKERQSDLAELVVCQLDTVIKSITRPPSLRNPVPLLVELERYHMSVLLNYPLHFLLYGQMMVV